MNIEHIDNWKPWIVANRRLARRKVRGYFRENMGALTMDALSTGKCALECRSGERCPVVQQCINKMREVRNYEGNQLELHMKRIDFARNKAIKEQLGL